MTKSNLACCYYPTTVVFIDDNKSFLDNILLGLDENINTRSFTEPTKAVAYLKSHALIPFADRYLRPLKDSENLDEFETTNIEHSYVDVDVFSIHKEINNPHRFNANVVVIVDYTMPEMNGMELCKALKGLPLKFVLITGDATQDNAIEAFNAGLIHQFIPKSSPDFMWRLQNTIHDLQEKQFAELSVTIIKNLSVKNTASLRDPVLVRFLKEFFREKNIVEYYLVNDSGCFLMASANGILSWLVVKNEDEMKEYTNTAIDNYGHDKIIKELQAREKILFLYTESDHINVTVDDWEKHLYPACKLVGENNIYYYSHIINMAKPDPFFDKIISYETFLTTQ